MKLLLKFFFFFIFIFPSSSQAITIYKKNDFSFELKGSYKNLFFSTKRILTDDPMIADLNRLRTQWDLRLTEKISAQVILDHEVIVGDFVNSEEFGGQIYEKNISYPDMDYEIKHENNFYFGENIYRAFMRFDFSPVKITIGRQRIGWGVMRLLSPEDLFTPLSIFKIEREEWVGTTSANLTAALGEGFKLNMAGTVETSLEKMRLGARLTKTIGRFDLSLMAGRFLQDKMIGFDFTGDIGKVGVRGEIIGGRTSTEVEYVQYALGVDYGFENSLYFAVEYFRNGLGVSHFCLRPNIGCYFPGVQIQSRHKNFLGVMAKYDFTPLWTITLNNIADLNGRSFFINPETKYSVLKWMDLVAGAQLPIGKRNGEFTLIPNTFYFQTQMYF